MANLVCTSPAAAPHRPHLLPLLGKLGRRLGASPGAACCSWTHGSKHEAQRVWVFLLPRELGAVGMASEGQTKVPVSPPPCFWCSSNSWGCASRAPWREARLLASPMLSAGAAQQEQVELDIVSSTYRALALPGRKWVRTCLKVLSGAGSRAGTTQQSTLWVTGDWSFCENITFETGQSLRFVQKAYLKDFFKLENLKTFMHSGMGLFLSTEGHLNECKQNIVCVYKDVLGKYV